MRYLQASYRSTTLLLVCVMFSASNTNAKPARAAETKIPVTFSGGHMSDIKSPHLLWLKFGLFIVLGLLASGVALALYPSLQLAGLFVTAIWAFCRAYYFAFYVIQHYIDPSYRFAGLSSVVQYVLRNRSDRDSSN